MKNQDIKLELLKLEVTHLNHAIKLCDEIIKVIPKFDGKQSNKRFDTALKGIDSNLHFVTRYNSFVIQLYKDNRSIQDDKGISHYLNDSYVNIIHWSIESSSGDGICQNGTINGKLLIGIIEEQRKYFQQRMDGLNDNINKIDEIIDCYKEMIKERETFKNNVSYLVRDYFDLNFK